METFPKDPYKTVEAWIISGKRKVKEVTGDRGYISDDCGYR